MATPPATPHRSARKPLDPISIPMASPSRRVLSKAGEDIVDNGILLYPYQSEEYSVGREIGSGQFSTVYEATLEVSRLPLDANNISRKRNDSVLSPPATPVRDSLNTPKRLLAVKKPVDRASAKVCRDEARILTHIRALQGHERYIVPFHGLDSCSNAIVMDVMPCSLDDVIRKQLNTLTLEQRTQQVSASFHRLTSYLIEGLKWLHSHDINHGDVKPGNILLRPSNGASSIPTFDYDPIYTDFSSATMPEEQPSSPRESPIAGGTWDYMYFGHIKESSDSHEVLNDGYGLMVTLLCYIIGESPYRSIPNRWLQMDARKKGRPLDFVMRDPDLAERFEALAACKGYEGLKTGFERAFNGGWRNLLQ